MRVRIDKLLVDRGLVSSRERAQRLIWAGAVLVSGQRVSKAGTLVNANAPIEVKEEDIPFVSRGGLKLASALDRFCVSVQNRVCLDVGASTGGFTDCLLQRGAAHVYAIDVGYGQFAWRLRQHPKVTLFERTNFRFFSPPSWPSPPDLATVDVSFISLKLLLPNLLRCVKAGGDVLALVKPQFEVGRGNVGSGGVVRDPTLREQAVLSVAQTARELGFNVLGQCPSPILGPKGNQEIFLHLRCPGTPPPCEEPTTPGR
ncbi:MAG: TlyA family rRNA (cytidine-2'-O)-methyltransferase [Candidatus Binatia bacterium]|nr:MAG: TlyA family rRNA (cytidine-2'-O)-methyltransferase [Candidatus Binatia bacterium]